MLALTLPAELWLEIFALATSDPLLLASDYQAFQPIHHHHQIKLDSGLSTLKALCVVCKRWNALASSLLYREIQIQHGSRDLLQSLQKSSVSLASTRERFTNGDMVRLIESYHSCTK